MDKHLSVTQALLQDGRSSTCLATEQGIAGTQRQAVRLPHDGADHEPQAEVKVFHQASDNLDLLKILLSKVSDIGLYKVEQLQNNGGDPAEMAGPGTAFKIAGEFARFDKGVKSRPVYLLLSGSKSRLHVQVAEYADVLLKVARVLGEIIRRAKLGGINKDGYQNGIALLLGTANQGLMAGVQCSHRRHQS